MNYFLELTVMMITMHYENFLRYYKLNKLLLNINPFISAILKVVRLYKVSLIYIFKYNYI